VSFSRGNGLTLESTEGVVPVDLYSVVCVRDRVASRKWFEVFFGRPADEVIGEEYLWQAGANAWVVIDDRYMRAARVGGTMITLGVTDLDDILARLAGHGIEHEPVETYGNGVRHVEVLDPDGNSLSLAEAPAR
jgi:catechol 2,3-dioxygenase-like lactoylglutathione lyase family enzyme